MGRRDTDGMRDRSVGRRDIGWWGGRSQVVGRRDRMMGGLVGGGGEFRSWEEELGDGLEGQSAGRRVWGRQGRGSGWWDGKSHLGLQLVEEGLGCWGGRSL